MNLPTRAVGELLLLVCAAWAVSGCCSGDSVAASAQTDECARLRQQLLEQGQQVDQLRAEAVRLERDVEILETTLTFYKHRWHPGVSSELSGSLWSPVSLNGEVAEIDGDVCRIRITANEQGVDVRSYLARAPFRFAIYDEHGYKAEARAKEFVGATGLLQCEVVFLKDDAQIRKGDKAATKP